MHWVRPLLCVALVPLFAVMGVQTGLAGEEPAPPTHVQAVLYEVFHGDTLHRMGIYVREIHVPDRKFSFHVINGELRVFRPREGRYAMKGDTITIPHPSSGQPVELRIFHVFGTEPRRIGELRLPTSAADRLEELLRTKTRLRALADGLLGSPDTYRGVVAYRSGNAPAARFVADLLAEAGITWVGVGNAGWDTLSVPPARVEEARSLLRRALENGLASPPDNVEQNPEWDRHLQYRVLGVDGLPEWLTDRTKVPRTPEGVDVLEHLARFPGSEVVEVDGAKRDAKYGDYGLEEAETALDGRWPRPWTVVRLKAWYAEVSIPPEDEDPESSPADGKVRAALVYLLAASRDPTALPLVGAALADEDLDVRVSATYGILEYWDDGPLEDGGLELAILRTQAWWDANRP